MRRIASVLCCLTVAVVCLANQAHAGLVSTGSGFFFSADGYIATNYLVIRGSNQIRIRDFREGEYDAEVVATDKSNDLAILKAKGSKFPYLLIKSSSEVRKGETVYTIGFPNIQIQGMEAKVTNGIISSLSGIAGEPNCYQVSVPVQPGNSGGALFDKSGAVIGVIVAKLDALTAFEATKALPENVNYAVKSNYLLELVRTKRKAGDALREHKPNHDIADAVQRAERATVLIMAFSDAAGTGQTSFRGCPDCPEMVAIPGRNYAIGKYEVTQKQWRMVMGNNPSVFSQCGGDCPVEEVSWNDAQDFIRKLNELTGQRYRLPTEAEWTYACYGSTQTEYCGGNDDNAVAWYDVNSGNRTHPAGQKRPNGYGLYDMSGNVWEWMEDCYDGKCVLRGGSWSYNSYSLRAANRIRVVPAIRLSDVGFRLARTLP